MRLFTAPFLLVIVLTAQTSTVIAAPKKHKTQCVETGNVYFFAGCDKNNRKCRPYLAIQVFMYNGDTKTRLFTFRCTLWHGYRLQKKKVDTMDVVLEHKVNALGGAVFTWKNMHKVKAKRRYKFKCTCTVSSLLLSKL